MKQPVIRMNVFVARREIVTSGGENKDQTVEAIQAQEFVHKGLQLSQEHLRYGFSLLLS